MAEQRHNDGADSLLAANWPGTGFADAAELAIINSDKTLKDLDRTGDTTDTTGGVNYIHIREGKPTLGDETNGDFDFEPKAGYTTKPNFIWATRGGRCRVKFSANVCKEAVFMAAGGVSFIVAGNVEKLKIAGDGIINILAGLDVQTELHVMGSAQVNIFEKAGDSIPIMHVSEQARVESFRRVIDVRLRQRCWVKLDNRSGSDTTNCQLEGGVLVPVAGSIPTVDWWGGEIDDSQVAEALSLGTTSFTVNGTGLLVPASTDLLTVGTPTPLFPAKPLSR